MNLTIKYTQVLELNKRRIYPYLKNCAHFYENKGRNSAYGTLTPRYFMDFYEIEGISPFILVVSFFLYLISGVAPSNSVIQ